MNLFSVLRAAMARSIANRIDRHNAIKLTGAFFFSGNRHQGVRPPKCFTPKGCAIIQVSVGLALTIAPVYIAEISPAIFRDLLTSFLEVVAF